MRPVHLLAVACLAVGVPLAGWGLAGGGLLAALAGLALVLAFVGLVGSWIAKSSRPMGAEQAIRPAAQPAWSLRDQPAGAPRRDGATTIGGRGQGGPDADTAGGGQ